MHEIDEEAPILWDRPLYQQLHNTCGLAAILMLVDPVHDLRLQQFLNQLSDVLSPIIMKINPILEKVYIKYQYALEYLLLKAQTTNATNFQFLYGFLQTQWGEAYDDQKIFNSNMLAVKREKYLEKNVNEYAKAYDRYILEGDMVPPIMLEDETNTQKTDFELKLLMEIMGFRFFPIITGDVTGAIGINDKNLDKNLESIIGAHINPKYRLLFGGENHWLALVGMYPKNLKVWRLKAGRITEKIQSKNLTLIYNDPMIPDQITKPLSDLDSSFRFFIFEQSDEDLSWLWTQIIEAARRDIPVEQAEMNIILRQTHPEAVLEPPSTSWDLNLDIFENDQVKAKESASMQQVKVKFATKPVKISFQIEIKPVPAINAATPIKINANSTLINITKPIKINTPPPSPTIDKKKITEDDVFR